MWHSPLPEPPGLSSFGLPPRCRVHHNSPVTHSSISDLAQLLGFPRKEILMASESPSAPTGSSHITISMAVLCAVGGVSGFAKTGSKPSLLAGLVIGSAFAAAAHMINDPHGDQRVAYGVATGASIVLSMAMGARFAKTRFASQDLLLLYCTRNRLLKIHVSVGSPRPCASIHSTDLHIRCVCLLVVSRLLRRTMWPAGSMCAAGALSAAMHGRKLNEWWK